MISFMYIILALLGLGVLVFIHELGHYLAARWVGMRVETFSIGFGKPVYRWQHQGVEWRICWLPFGGFVRIAGMEKEGGKEPHEIPDGFYGKKPLDRLKVVLAGPLVNIIFAFVFFMMLWGSGGRDKNFSAYTHTIGWVDTKSELFIHGVRPGDRITEYDGHPFNSFKDHLYAPMFGDKKIRVQGTKMDMNTKEEIPFNYLVNTYQHPSVLEDGIKTVGILGSASYLFYESLPGNKAPLIEGSPMKESGIQYGDRLYWVDGEIIFSLPHLSYLLNDGRALLTVKRGKDVILMRAPRVNVGELRMDLEHREEISDWQYEAGLGGVKFVHLYTIPYNLNDRCMVEETLNLIDRERQEEVFSEPPFSQREQALLPGDVIIAVDGVPVTRSYELLKQVQSRQAHIIVDRNSPAREPIQWTGEEPSFVLAEDSEDLEAIAQSIGTKFPVSSAGRFVLLDPVIPKKRSEFTLAPEKRALLQAEKMKQRKEIESWKDAEKRSQALAALEEQDQELLLGVWLQDRQIRYNPGPVSLFVNVCQEIWRTLSALVFGYLHPKFMAGPIGIVQVMQVSWMVSFKEAFFWLGAISLNLGFLNLLPIPFLDGGYVCISLFEMVTGRRLKPKTIERMIIPFAVLLICLMVFLTFNDLMRILGRFFRW